MQGNPHPVERGGQGEALGRRVGGVELAEIVEDRLGELVDEILGQVARQLDRLALELQQGTTAGGIVGDVVLEQGEIRVTPMSWALATEAPDDSTTARMLRSRAP